MKMDLHCHVKEGSVDSGVTVEEYIAKLETLGYEGMLITDHDTYDGYRYWGKNLKGNKYQNFVVLKGIEYDTVDGGHILCIMPEGVDLKLLELRGLHVADLIDFVHRHGGVLGPAHPYGPRFMSFMHTRAFKKTPELLDQFDFIETYNAAEDEESNVEAKELAEQLDKPGTGGTDSHRLDSVGYAYTELPKPVATESDLISLIHENVKFETGGRHYPHTTKDKLGKWNNVLVYGYWPYNEACTWLRKGQRRKQSKKENML